MRLKLKVAILETGKTQRQVALDARIPEGRLSDLVRGRGWPTTTERSALNKVLRGDLFESDESTVEVRTRRRSG